MVSVLRVSLVANCFALTMHYLGSHESIQSSITVDGNVDLLGKGLKDLIATMNELEKLGLGNQDITLAKCVVTGKLLLPLYQCCVQVCSRTRSRGSICWQVVSHRGHYGYQSPTLWGHVHSMPNVHQDGA